MAREVDMVQGSCRMQWLRYAEDPRMLFVLSYSPGSGWYGSGSKEGIRRQVVPSDLTEFQDQGGRRVISDVGLYRMSWI
jgi:hypothetical protein